MAITRRPPVPRLPLVRSLLRTAGGQTPDGHLHFDRAARVWRSHEERERLVETAQPECA